MKSPIQSAKQKDVTIDTNQVIVNQGTIPYKHQEAAPVSPAPKGRQKARGFGLQMRPTEYLVR